MQTADAFRFSGSLLPLLTLSEDDADRQHLLIPLCQKRKGFCIGAYATIA